MAQQITERRRAIRFISIPATAGTPPTNRQPQGTIAMAADGEVWIQGSASHVAWTLISLPADFLTEGGTINPDYIND